MQTDPPTVISKMVFTTSEEAKSTFSQKTPPIKLTSGQTLYIDEGTTLYGRIEARGSNITITGRGTLSGAKLQHVGNQYASGNILIDVLNNNGSNNCSGFKINGITIVDTPSWCLRIFNTDDVTIDNINMIHWILNGDGIDICTGKRISIYRLHAPHLRRLHHA